MKLIDNASGNVSRGITLDSTNKADKYRINYNCNSIGIGKSYIRIYATLSDATYKTYFMPIQFNGDVSFEFPIDSSSTFLQFDMIGDATLTEITFETVVDATMEYVKENATYWDRIKEITSNTGKVRTEMLEGLINMTLNAFSNESGTITQENGVMTWLNGTTVENSTQAVQITGGAIRIANSKLANGAWNWTTAISGAGINAATIIAETFAALNITGVTITAGTITGGTINGVTINGSTFISNDPYGQQMMLEAGQLKFKKKDGKTSMIDSSSIVLWGANNSTLRLQPYDDFSLGQGAIIDSNGGNLILGHSGVQSFLKFSSSGDVYLNAGYGGDGNIHLSPKTSSNEVIVYGAFKVLGSKNAIIPTQHYGVRSMYAEEADKSYFSTKGIAETINGVCIVELDPMFLEVIELNSTVPYIIQLTSYSDARIWVDLIEDDKFIIKSDKDTKLSYDLKAIRISYTDIYMEESIIDKKKLAEVQEAVVRRIAKGGM